MCCVIPPASEAATAVCLRLSSRVVFPWSTCPITATTGGRGTREAGSRSTGDKMRSNLGVWPTDSSNLLLSATDRVEPKQTEKVRVHQSDRGGLEMGVSHPA